jgi:Activator of Hsp90 ATPase homolog 1-like protein
MTQLAPVAPVHKTITVNASLEHAFHVFTEDFDSWWPRSHHIGKAPLKKAIVEGRVGGRCYSEQADDTECDWGRILVWEPPQRFVMAWQIDSGWAYQPDLAKASEVEVRFTAEPDGRTRVDLEHRHFERMGAGWDGMRTMVDSPSGWGATLQLYLAQVEAHQ